MDEENGEESMVQQTVDAMLQTPYPVEYLNLLLQHRIVDPRLAHRAGLLYIDRVNKFYTFVHMTHYNTRSFEDMTLEHLQQYIQFVVNLRLTIPRGQTLYASTL